MLEFNKRKRDKLDIMGDILNACKEEGINKTRLMYAAGITYEVAKKYLPELEKIGYIVRKDNMYYLTEKGKKAAEILAQIKEKKKELKQLLDKFEQLNR
ncbi:MAG: winged helix-turn-helix domain-containing protein [Sulfolobus sp.]